MDGKSQSETAICFQITAENISDHSLLSQQNHVKIE
jgi:hypothetical protein